jgi:hypothetical protein
MLYVSVYAKQVPSGVESYSPGVTCLLLSAGHYLPQEHLPDLATGPIAKLGQGEQGYAARLNIRALQ